MVGGGPPSSSRPASGTCARPVGAVDAVGSLGLRGRSTPPLPAPELRDAAGSRRGARALHPSTLPLPFHPGAAGGRDQRPAVTHCLTGAFDAEFERPGHRGQPRPHVVHLVDSGGPGGPLPGRSARRSAGESRARPRQTGARSRQGDAAAPVEVFAQLRRRGLCPRRPASTTSSSGASPSYTPPDLAFLRASGLGRPLFALGSAHRRTAPFMIQRRSRSCPCTSPTPSRRVVSGSPPARRRRHAPARHRPARAAASRSRSRRTWRWPRARQDRQGRSYRALREARHAGLVDRL
jgi:hypothetical protein